MCDRPFRLTVSNLHFVGHPTTISADAPGGSSSSAASPGAGSTDPSPRTVTFFNVVFAMEWVSSAAEEVRGPEVAAASRAASTLKQHATLAPGGLGGGFEGGGGPAEAKRSKAAAPTLGVVGQVATRLARALLHEALRCGFLSEAIRATAAPEAPAAAPPASAPPTAAVAAATTPAAAVSGLVSGQGAPPAAPAAPAVAAAAALAQPPNMAPAGPGPPLPQPAGPTSGGAEANQSTSAGSSHLSPTDLAELAHPDAPTLPPPPLPPLLPQLEPSPAPPSLAASAGALADHQAELATGGGGSGPPGPGPKAVAVAAAKAPGAPPLELHLPTGASGGAADAAHAPAAGAAMLSEGARDAGAEGGTSPSPPAPAVELAEGTAERPALCGGGPGTAPPEAAASEERAAAAPAPAAAAAAAAGILGASEACGEGLLATADGTWLEAHSGRPVAVTGRGGGGSDDSDDDGDGDSGDGYDDSYCERADAHGSAAPSRQSERAVAGSISCAPPAAPAGGVAGRRGLGGEAPAARSSAGTSAPEGSLPPEASAASAALAAPVECEDELSALLASVHAALAGGHSLHLTVGSWPYYYQNTPYAIFHAVETPTSTARLKINKKHAGNKGIKSAHKPTVSKKIYHAQARGS